MAIQVGGTQVISNSQGLTNITSIDSTTAAAIGAAGVGGGGTVEMTADGSISAGDVVGISATGKVKTTESVFGPTTLSYTQASGYMYGLKLAYDQSSNKVAFAGRDTSSSSGRMKIIVGTVASNGSITWGTHYEYTGFTFVANIGLAMHNNVIVVTCKTSNYGNYIMGIAFGVSGTTINSNSGPSYLSGSGGNAANLGGGNYLMPDVNNSGKFVLAYSENSSYSYPYVAMITATGSSFSFTKTQVTTAVNSIGERCGIAWSPTYNKFMGWWANSSNNSVACEISTSGSTLSIGTPINTTLSGMGVDHYGFGFDSVSGDYVLVTRSGGTMYAAIVNTSSSGAAQSWGKVNSLRQGFSGDYYAVYTYDAATNEAKVGVWGLESPNSYLFMLAVTGEDVTIKDTITVTDYTGSIYGTELEGLHGRGTFLTWGNPSPTNAQHRNSTEVNTKSSYFKVLGISEGTYSNGQTATITVTGGTTSQISGLSAGAGYGPSSSSGGDLAPATDGNFAIALKTNELLLR
jgi:hypothetical protein